VETTGTVQSYVDLIAEHLSHNAICACLDTVEDTAWLHLLLKYKQIDTSPYIERCCNDSIYSHFVEELVSDI